MFRVLVVFLVIALIAVGAVWIADNPGDVTIVWLGAETRLSVGVAAIGVLLLAAAIALVWSLLRFVLRIPRLLTTGSRARRQDKGFSALSKGLIAVGSGDVAGAQRYAQDARRLVGGHPLSLLLDAQSAQLAGDKAGARRAFQSMTRIEQARLLGWRGLFIEAKRAGDEDAARHAADEAVAAAPSAAWANEAALSDRCARRDWAGARQALERAERLRALDKTASRRQRAVLFTAEAQDVVTDDPAQALTLAKEACHLAPDLTPAVALAARLMGERGDIRKAARLIETAWKSAPHPDLVAVYTHLRAGDSALDRLQKAQTLAKLAPRDPESRFAVAEAAIDARELPLARSELDALIADAPTMKACLLMADLVELEDSDQGATRYWVSRAAHAPRDKAWIADGVTSDTWLPVSPTTGRLDAFVWATPPDLISRSIEPLESAAPAPIAPAPLAPAAPASSDPRPALILAPPPPADTEAPQSAAAAAIETPARSSAPPPPQDAAPTSAPAASPAKPTPVVFPVPHAPDDPGPDASRGERRWRVFNG